jgi:uncharacterized repeat protein (TIGR03837 family)
MQCRVEQLAGYVTSEWPTGSVGAFFARAETDDEQFSVQGTKGRHRQGMPVRVALTNVGQVFGQSWTGSALGGVLKSWHGWDVSMAAMQLHWDIFCRVIDNYGDIGVCWRLARQLAGEHGRRVRLWVDDPASLQPMCPTVNIELDGQLHDGVEIRHWGENAPFDRSAEVVIEAFACDLPDAYLEAMAKADPKPCWINLEYLTAESWADDCHGMASPHPSLPLIKYFFFPGFSGAGGGLLREKRLLDERDQSHTQTGGSQGFEISLFCYDTAPVGGLIDALAKMPKPVTCHVPPGKPLAAVRHYLGGAGPWQCGNASIRSIPFMPMDDYDRLLWRCNVNFVRGEDSFVRAQWAGKPFVWQIYRQDEDAHLVKLDAFLDRYCLGMDEKLEIVVREMFLAWNTGGNVEAAWTNFIANYADIARHNINWVNTQASVPDLASALVKFCTSKV